MKHRLSRIIVSILILSLALQAFTFPVLAQPEPNESQVGIETPIILPESGFENSPLQLAAPYQRHLETDDRPVYIPPSREIIAKTQEQVNSFNCASVIDVSPIECEALVALYNSTNGAGWFFKSEWLQGTKVADWYGVTVGSGVVTHLNLSNNLLNGSIPSTLSTLSNLQELRLGDNQLTGSIPSTLSTLSNLQILDLGMNSLSGSIPTELSSLSNLQGLYLNGNQLSGSIPSSLGNLSNLQRLYLNNNQLTGSIPLSFVKLTKLSHFFFSVNNLCEPTTPEFLAWKKTVGAWLATGLICKDELICLPLIFR